MFLNFVKLSRYHLGTLAFGSLLITIITIIRMIISSARDNLQKSDNGWAKALLCVLECLVSMIEEFLRMINRRAYIITAVHGTDFMTSAKTAFHLIMRNLLSVIALDNVSSKTISHLNILQNFTFPGYRFGILHDGIVDFIGCNCLFLHCHCYYSFESVYARIVSIHLFHHCVLHLPYVL